MQNSNLNMLANNLKQMRNPKHIGASIGIVVKVSPLTVSIAGGSILLTEGEELHVSERLKDKKYDGTIKIEDGSITGTLNGDSVTISDVAMNQDAEITIKPEIKKGDYIFVVPMNGEQMWVAVDRVGGSS